MTKLQQQGAAAKRASRVLAVAGSDLKNRALIAIADALPAAAPQILAANQLDLQAARKIGTSDAMLDRLALTETRIAGIAEGVRQVAALPDPIGEITHATTRPNGLMIAQKQVPLGVIGIIYEARPNVTVDAAALCLKAGNAVILRGGSKAFHSSLALVELMRDCLTSSGLPADAISLVADTSRESAEEMMGLSEYLDVLIPRGGAGLIRHVVNNARVPVIQTGVGICHVYVDKDANLDMAAEIIHNAKCSRPSVCNAIEGVIIHREVAGQFLVKMADALSDKQVELRACPESLAILSDRAIPAQLEDFDTEFLDYVLAVKVVGDLDEALAFIAEHGTGHSEAVITENYTVAQRFLNEVDAAAVYVNASTRFTDGFEFGLGAEIGISTQKLHARGPMGLRELTSSKYIVYGSGQIR